MKKILFWPYLVYGWLILMPLAAILTLVFASLTVISSILVNPHFASRVFGVGWARSLAILTPISVAVLVTRHARFADFSKFAHIRLIL